MVFYPRDDSVGSWAHCQCGTDQLRVVCVNRNIDPVRLIHGSFCEWKFVSLPPSMDTPELSAWEAGDMPSWAFADWLEESPISHDLPPEVYELLRSEPLPSIDGESKVTSE